jgi:hypothetical protein
VSGEAGAKSRVSLQALSSAHPARAMRRNLERNKEYCLYQTAFPANAGIHRSAVRAVAAWVPAFAGTAILPTVSSLGVDNVGGELAGGMQWVLDRRRD